MKYGKMKYGKAAHPSGLVSEIVKVAGETGFEMITDLVNQIIVEVIPAEWKLSTIVNCDKWKGDSLERGNYREMKLTDQILKIVERIVEKLIRQQVEINEMQFSFMPGFGTANVIFISRQNMIFFVLTHISVKIIELVL